MCVVIHVHERTCVRASLSVLHSRHSIASVAIFFLPADRKEFPSLLFTTTAEHPTSAAIQPGLSVQDSIGFSLSKYHWNPRVKMIQQLVQSDMYLSMFAMDCRRGFRQWWGYRFNHRASDHFTHHVSVRWCVFVYMTCTCACMLGNE